jgi:hypothetical protein
MWLQMLRSINAGVLYFDLNAEAASRRKCGCMVENNVNTLSGAQLSEVKDCQRIAETG